MNTKKKYQTPTLSINYADKLNTLEQIILDKQVQIESWFRKRWEQTPPPWMASVDLRNAGFKLAPVDTNLFPAGFNNLSTKVLPLCVQAMQATFQQKFPGCERVLLIPESHTRNYFYLESLARLHKIIEQAGYDVRIASLLPDLQNPVELDLPSGEILKLEPLLRSGDKVSVEGFTPCVVLLNHDLSEGIP